jgi:hypothetical protein
MMHIAKPKRLQADLRDLYKAALAAFEKGSHQYAIELVREILRQEPTLLDARSQLREVELDRIGCKSNCRGRFCGADRTATGASSIAPSRSINVTNSSMYSVPPSFQAAISARAATGEPYYKSRYKFSKSTAATGIDFYLYRTGTNKRGVDLLQGNQLDQRPTTGRQVFPRIELLVLSLCCYQPFL